MVAAINYRSPRDLQLRPRYEPGRGASRSLLADFSPSRPAVGFRAPAAGEAAQRDAPHAHGSPGGHSQPPVSAWLNAAFTIRSSPEWYAIATHLPSGRRADMARGRHLRQLLELLVDRDAQGLEDPGCRMAATSQRGRGRRAHRRR